MLSHHPNDIGAATRSHCLDLHESKYPEQLWHVRRADNGPFQDLYIF